MAMLAATVPTHSVLRIKASSSTHSNNRRLRRPQNVDGDLFVDNTCIDCDTCRWMAPEIFNQQDGKSAVFKQPACHEERMRALQGVYHCGYHSEKSYGAASYFILRPEGNILIDSPRYTERLAGNIKKMGGARFMFLTHKDDVADHDKWSKELDCTRILHSEEVRDNTADVEIKLEGNGPWTLGTDVTLIHTPGHTEGSVCLLDKTRKVLFTGDHLLMDEFGLSILDQYNWFSVTEQLKSVQKLLELDFEWILPGHGRRASFSNAQEKDAVLQAFLAARGC